MGRNNSHKDEIQTKFMGTAELMLSLQDYNDRLKDRVFMSTVF